MKEIKFKRYHFDENKKLIRISEWGKIERKGNKFISSENQFTSHTNVANSDSFIDCQYTGFKDKNGKEIYGSDIIGDWVETDNGLIQSKILVYFDERIGCWMVDLSFENDRSFSSSLFAELEDFEYEILGHIYENDLKNEKN